MAVRSALLLGGVAYAASPVGSPTFDAAPAATVIAPVFTPADSVTFGPSTSNAVSYVVNAPIGQNATVTTLRVIQTPALSGIPVVLLANIAPVGAAGTIQFMDGTSALSAAVPATDGFALLIIRLSNGEHSLTAVFTPTNQAVFVLSASLPVLLRVAPPI